MRVVAIPNKRFENYEGAWVIVFIYHQSEYGDNCNVLPTKDIYTKVKINEADRAIRLLELFYDLAVLATHDNVINIEKLKEISEKDDKIQKELLRKEAITNIMQILDKDDDIEKIIDECTYCVSDYLRISIVAVVKADKVKKNIQMISEMYDKGAEGFRDRMKSIALEIVENYSDEAMITVEQGDAHEDLRKIANKYGIKSMVTIPIVSTKEPGIYAIFAETRYDMSWDTNTVKFLFDVSKMLQECIYRRITKNSLISSYTALKEILNNLDSGILVIDKRTKEILFNNDTIAESPARGFIEEQCYNYDYECCNQDYEESVTKKDKNIFIERYDKKNDKWYDMYYSDIKWVDGRTVMLCNIIDITDKKKYQQKIEFQANNDFLTGLYNRMKCEQDLDFLVNESERINSKGAVLFIDLDNFKHINDGLGHQYGDMLLKMVAAAMQRIEGIENRCYRVGGDEFIVIIEPAIFNDYRRIIDSVLKVFAEPWYLGDMEYYCTMSMGVVTFPDRGRTVNDLVKKADIAMYDAKKNGKNGFRYYSEGEDAHSYKKLDIEKNMRIAIEEGCKEFEIYIQPIMDTASENCLGGEALVRWNSTSLGFLMPGEFIPIAEHMGYIVPIGEHVLRTACSISKKWSDMGINKRINVNLSVIQLLENNIVEVIRKIVREIDIVTSNLVLEVTESLAINDMNRMKQIISEIKRMGIKIALDDFGTGYSSLSYIKQMDLDIIKVDREFIKDIAEDDYAQAFVKLIADLSKKLEVQVCVEGVEDKAQLDTLRALNINMIQGFYYGKPMRVEEFEARFLGIKHE